jgi:hypothetical protein
MKSFLQIGALVFLIVVNIILYKIYRAQESEKYNYAYDYNRENPNALTCGKNIAGTVYASYPDNVPGLGWIV